MEQGHEPGSLRPRPAKRENQSYPRVTSSFCLDRQTRTSVLRRVRLWPSVAAFRRDAHAELEVCDIRASRGSENSLRSAILVQGNSKSPLADIQAERAAAH